MSDESITPNAERRTTRTALTIRDATAPHSFKNIITHPMVPHRVLTPFLVALLSPRIRPARSFAAKSKSSSLVAMRRRALAKVASNHNATKERKGNGQRQASATGRLSKAFLLEALDEALFRQRSSIEAIDREVERKRVEMAETDAATVAASADADTNDGERDMKTGNLEPKEGGCIDVMSRVEARREELFNIESRIRNLRHTTEQTGGQLSEVDLERIKQQIAELGHGSIFRQTRSAWRSTKAREREFGRPRGFDGDVFHSPLGVPILVGRTGAHRDDAMRSAAQGSDLWFQAEDCNGSRVLLRTSLMRGTEGSKRCRQMAADLAAKYSVWGEEHDSIPVMYTDSRKVAKRGSRVGNMKRSKSLGRIMGYPRNVV